MRRVTRQPLDAAVENDLNRRQGEADQKQITGTLHPANEWKAARQSQPLFSVLAQLKTLMHGPHASQQFRMFEVP